MELNVNRDDTTIIVGDIHGNLDTLLKLIQILKKTKPQYIIFLGDLVDRGQYQLECLLIVLCLKLLEPKKYYILKGNHESLEMNKYYGFFQEFQNKFLGQIDFNNVLGVYDSLPLCSIINRKILCIHGGIPKNIEILNNIREIKTIKYEYMLKKIETGFMELLWNDPKENLKGFSDSFRGPGIYNFGKDVFDKFLDKYGLELLVRAHEFFSKGYRWFFDKRLLSIFSSANYRGYGSNPASYAVIRNNKVIPELVK